MDFVNKAISSVTPSSAEPKAASEEKKPSTDTGIISGAKDTASAGLGKVAGATGDLLGAVKEYGKLNASQGVGKYVDQAETYVRSYETSAGTAPVVEEKKTEGGGGGGYLKAAEGLFKM